MEPYHSVQTLFRMTEALKDPKPEALAELDSYLPGKDTSDELHWRLTLSILDELLRLPKLPDEFVPLKQVGAISALIDAVGRIGVISLLRKPNKQRIDLLFSRAMDLVAKADPNLVNRQLVSKKIIVPTRVAKSTLGTDTDSDKAISNLTTTELVSVYLGILQDKTVHPAIVAQCGKELSNIAIQPGGIKAVMKCVILESGSDLHTDRMACTAVAKVLTRTPVQLKANNYDEKLVEQLLELLRPEEEKLNLCASVCLQHLLARKSPEEFDRAIKAVVGPLAELSGHGVEWLKGKHFESLPWIRNMWLVLCHRECRDLVLRMDEQLFVVLLVALFRLSTGERHNSNIEDLILQWIYAKDMCPAMFLNMFMWPVRNCPLFEHLQISGEHLEMSFIEDPIHVDVECWIKFVFLLFDRLAIYDRIASGLFLKLLETIPKEEQSNAGMLLCVLAEMTCRLADCPSPVIASSDKTFEAFEAILNFMERVHGNWPEMAEALVLLLRVLKEQMRTPEELRRARQLASKIQRQLCDVTARNPLVAEMLKDLYESTQIGLIDDVSAGDSGDPFSTVKRLLSDPLMPARAHGLVMLRRLLEAGQRCPLSMVDEVRSCMMDRENDSYLYLPAVNALVAMVTCMPEGPSFTCPLLMDWYMHGSVEDRLKTGEAIVKVICDSGQLSSFYLQDAVNRFLHTAEKSDEALLRASALSCAGQLVESDPAGSWVHRPQVLNTAVALSKDKDETVRRAAVMLLSKLVSCGKLTDIGEIVKDLYKALKDAEQDQDEIAARHATAGLEALKGLVIK